MSALTAQQAQNILLVRLTIVCEFEPELLGFLMRAEQLSTACTKCEDDSDEQNRFHLNSPLRVKMHV